MAEPESLRQVAHSRAPLSTWLGIVLLFALFGVIVLAVIGPAPRGSDYEGARAKKRADVLKTTRDEATKALTTYGWIDKNKGVARVPIERAMELTIAELAQKKTGSGWANRHAGTSTAGSSARVSAAERCTQTYFSCWSEPGESRSTGRGNQSAERSAWNATRRVGFACWFASSASGRATKSRQLTASDSRGFAIWISCARSGKNAMSILISPPMKISIFQSQHGCH